jgi:hypothetical protein
MIDHPAVDLSGLLSGFQHLESKPDKRLACAISDLASICRVCRVLSVVHTPGRIEFLSNGPARSAYSTDSIGLE